MKLFLFCLLLFLLTGHAGCKKEDDGTSSGYNCAVILKKTGGGLGFNGFTASELDSFYVSWSAKGKLLGSDTFYVQHLFGKPDSLYLVGGIKVGAGPSYPGLLEDNDYTVTIPATGAIYRINNIGYQRRDTLLSVKSTTPCKTVYANSYGPDSAVIDGIVRYATPIYPAAHTCLYLNRK